MSGVEAGPPTPKVGASVRHGLRWMGLSVVIGRASRFLMMIVLARLLAKDAFGLVLTANAAMEIPQALREVGFGQAFVQREFESEEAERRGLDTTFTISFAVNALLFIVVMLAVPSIATFFDKIDGLAPVLRVVMLGLLTDAFVVAPSALLQRRLEYGRDTRATIGGVLALTVTSVACAASGLGAWSLVVGQHASKLTTIFLLFRYTGWRPRFRVDRDLAHRLFSFGKFMWGSSILRAAGGVLDRVLLGRMLGAGAVAVYGIAFNLCNMPATQVGYAVGRVAFPALSRLQHDLPTMRRTVLSAVAHISIVVLPIGFGLLAVAPDFVTTVYGIRWADAIPVVQVLSFYGMALAIGSPAGPALQAMGRPGIIMWAAFVRQVLLVTLLWQLASFGMIGVAYAVLIPLLLAALFGLSCLVWVVGCRASQVTAAVLRPALAALAMLGVVVLVAKGIFSWPRSLRLGVEVAAGGLTYVLASFAFNRGQSLELLQTLRKTIDRRSA